jgi:hypothetical protein
MDLFMPDLAWTARMSGGFAGVWALLRTGLMLRSLRRPQPDDSRGRSSLSGG